MLQNKLLIFYLELKLQERKILLRLSMRVRLQACACAPFIVVRQWTGAHVWVALD